MSKPIAPERLEATNTRLLTDKKSMPNSPSGLAMAFLANQPRVDTSETTRFYFAYAQVDIDSERSFELALEAEPVYLAKLGLGWSMWLSGWEAHADSCDSIFEIELPQVLSQKLALSKHPLADAIHARPALLSKATRAMPGLAAALASLASKEEARLISTTVREAPTRSRRRPL